MRPAFVSVLVLVVLTADCDGLLGDDGQSVGDEPEDDELLPGLTDSGVTDRHLLLREHDNTLEDEAYRTEWERTVSDGSEAVLGYENSSQVVAAGGTSAHERIVREDETGSLEHDRWIDAETPLVRQNESGSVTYVPDSIGSVEPTPPISIEEAYAAADSITDEEGTDERYVLDRTDR